MLNLSRRTMLAILPASLAANAAMPLQTFAAEAPASPFLVDWEALSPATRTLVLNDYWNALSLDQKRTAAAMLRERGMSDVADLLMPQWTGPGVYEFKLLDDSARGWSTCPTAFLDRVAKRGASGDWYRWQHYWKGGFQGRGHFVRADRLRIVRKGPALDA